MTCDEITKNLRFIDASDRRFVDSLNSGKAREVFKNKQELEDQLEPILEILDPNHLVVRKRLARKFGFDYVGDIYDKQVTVGIGFSSVSDKDIWLLDKDCWLMDVKRNTKPLFRYDRLTPFHNGSAWATNMSWINEGFVSEDFLIDTEGKVLFRTEGKYELSWVAEEWDGSPVPVLSHENLSDHFFVTADGRQILHYKDVKGLDKFCDGVIWGMIDDKWTLFDQNGTEKFTLKDNFDEVGEYQDGYCLLGKYLDDNIKLEVYVVDKAGKSKKLDGIVTQNTTGGRNDLLIKQENGWFIGYNDDEEYFAFNLAGEKKSFGESRVQAVLNNGYYLMSHFIPGTAQHITILMREPDADVKKMFEHKNPFFNGFMEARLFPAGETYFLSLDGKLIGAGFEEVLPFCEGVAAVRDDKGWYFIDEEGKNTFKNTQLRFKSFPGLVKKGRFFSGVVAVIDHNDKQYFIDKEGRKVF